MVSILLIASNNKFLLLKRSPSDHNFANHWGLPGGGVEAGESPNDAVIREVSEEMGLSIKDTPLLKKYKYFNTKIYLFTHNSSEFNPNEIVLNNEHTEWGMFSYKEILQMKDIIPSNITFIEDYLSKASR